MNVRKFSLKKNLALNAVFITLITASLLAALVIAYNFTSRYVYNEFERQKIDVLEATFKPYNDFFQNKIPEISFYQGYLDSASAAKYCDTVLKTFPFVHRIIFYDTQISNHDVPYSYTANKLSVSPKAIFQFGYKLPADSAVIFKASLANTSPRLSIDEFNRMAAKLSVYLQNADTSKNIVDEDLFGVFYNITPNRVTFMNIPREEELKIFKSLMLRNSEYSPEFEQDILSFKLNPSKLTVINNHPKLYQDIKIKPITFEPVNTDSNLVITELPLSGAFASNKLYFTSSQSFLSLELGRRFLPFAVTILIVYGVLIFIGFLIYRNLRINNKLFKLQYDFVNNLTHEFKTPLSVIKIAGNNIKSASQLSERELTHYGKILDEEADKLNDLMNKLLSFTQIENQSIQIKNSRVNLEVFIQNMVDAYQIKYPDFNVSYHINQVEFFNTDPVLLSSLFQNLIDNAYKYSLPGKKQLHIDVGLQKADIILRFKDQGIGIPKNEMENIFRKFYRIQSEYNQQGSVGLGLAFCKELVKFMHGNISVKSKVGIGSEFTIILPYT
ncbi:sensor histidine kinase [Desertivirga xinjiangensis]|uniref:sensor histidine kinase n=1 Tax=Desertivirga xinjiangensis TaxID=539206 RepID=UPI0021093E45|nr:HAMP domain-containing sensor histidine kinase [Pedobacter xinjiangensis]